VCAALPKGRNWSPTRGGRLLVAILALPFWRILHFGSRILFCPKGTTSDYLLALSLCVCLGRPNVSCQRNLSRLFLPGDDLDHLAQHKQNTKAQPSVFWRLSSPMGPSCAPLFFLFSPPQTVHGASLATGPVFIPIGRLLRTRAASLWRRRSSTTRAAARPSCRR